MTCKNCGAKLAAGEAFCGKCGAPVTPERPSREEIRARVQGGGRQSAPARGRAPAARAAGPISLDKSKLFILIAAILGLLQIVYLFVKSIFISISYGEMTASEGASIYTVLKEGEAGFLGVLLLLFCLALVASIAVPVLLRRQPRPLATIVVAGLTLLGGDPFEEENQEALLGLLEQIRERYGNSRTIWAYTGYVYERDLVPGGRKHTDATDRILAALDVLVDGPFILEQKNLMLQFRGSANQRILDMPSTLERGEAVLAEGYR